MNDTLPSGVPRENELGQNGWLTLDPADWDDFRALGHEILDDLIDYLRKVRDRPAWRAPRAESRQAFDAPVPRHGRRLADVYADFKRYVLPYPTGNIHPRFWGWVMGNGTPVGLLADMLASAMNCHVSGYDQAATLVERQVLAWLTELLDFPRHSSGILVSGGTVANLVALTVARDHATNQRVRKDGIDRAAGAMTVYGSLATHAWAERCCDLLGLGENGFRKIPVDARHKIRIDELARTIRRDRDQGMKPICLIGNAGTVTCGATDDLNALADLAADERLWFHIDGAFGALAKLSRRYRQLCDGLERADSLAFDLHKWGYIQYEVGAVLFRDAMAHANSFSFSPAYLETAGRGIAVNPTEFAGKGIQLSRGFRALKVWMQLSTYGSDQIGVLIEQNIEQAQYLKKRVTAEPDLELLGPAEMNVVCFRFVAPGWTDHALDMLNAELLVRVQESGMAVPSNARIDGRFALRVAHTNHRSRLEDFDVLVEQVITLGRELAADPSRKQRF